MKILPAIFEIAAQISRSIVNSLCQLVPFHVEFVHTDIGNVFLPAQKPIRYSVNGI